MAATNFEQVVEMVKALTGAEQWRLKDLLEIWLAQPRRPMTEEEFKQEMVKAGILSVPPPLTDYTSHHNWKPVEIEGKPLSETIIEERR